MHTQRDLIIQLPLVEASSSTCHSLRRRKEIPDRGCGQRFGSSGLAREGKRRRSRLVEVRPRNPSQGSSRCSLLRSRTRGPVLTPSKAHAFSWISASQNYLRRDQDV